MVLLLGLIIIIGLEERELHEPCNTCLYCVSEYKAEVISHVEAPLRAVEEISICSSRSAEPGFQLTTVKLMVACPALPRPLGTRRLVTDRDIVLRDSCTQS